ncbi:hypothetical protein [Streptomyces sp. NPDC048606]|uniref:hypothetical protein n=1 Tax=Streptomyces sp. NPDC048606 TaxID=3154726 RepID=UPI003413E35A
MQGKMTFRSAWNILVGGLGLACLLVGYACVAGGLWSKEPVTVCLFVIPGLWMVFRAPLCRTWVDSRGVGYAGILAWKQFPWEAIEDITCEVRGGVLLTSAMPVIKLKDGRSVSLDELAGYTAGDDENARVSMQIHEMNAARRRCQSSSSQR